MAFHVGVQLSQAHLLGGLLFLFLLSVLLCQRFVDFKWVNSYPTLSQKATHLFFKIQKAKNTLSALIQPHEVLS